MGLEILDFKRRFQRGLANPFEAVPVADLPFTLYGLEWCPRCDMEVECNTKAVNQGSLYLYKRLCGRCGKVLKRGIYDKSFGRIPRLAFEWTNVPGIDRR